MCRILMHWPATFPISREGRRFITFIITLFRGVGASAAHTWRGIRAVPLRACGALLDLAGKRERGNSDQVVATPGPTYPTTAVISRSDRRKPERGTEWLHQLH